MIAILKKELSNYFGTWIAPVILCLFSIICSLFLFLFENNFNIFDIGTASLESFFSISPWVLMFVIPAISMRSIAEEGQTGTLEWLFSQPLRVRDILLGKYFAVWLIGIACILTSVFYLYTIYVLGIPRGNLDFGMTMGSYIGLFFLIGAFSAVGILSSSFSSNQVTAYLSGLFLNFILWFGTEQLASYKLLGTGDFILQNAGFQYHFSSFSKGLIDSRDIFYFLFIIVLCLAISFLSIEKKKCN